jgi:uncharacterized protein YdhG (YjbR/CyaY superfamily)
MNQVKRTEPESVDNYLAALPEDRRAALEKLRKVIKTAVPKAEEVISYQIPAYRYRGKLLVFFAAFKDHCSFFVGRDVMRAHAAELKGYDLTKGGIRFPANKPLPAALVKKLVKARIIETQTTSTSRSS